AIEGNLVGHFDLIGEMRLDLSLRDWRRQQGSPLDGGAGKFSDRNIRRAQQRRGWLEGGAAPVGQNKTAIAAVLGDTVGERERQHDAGRRQLNVSRYAGFIICRHLRSPALR